MPSLKHQDNVSEICTLYKAQTKGFAKSVASAIELENLDPVYIDLVPDAYLIDASKKVVTCFEVERFSHCTENKMGKYAELWFELDCDDWTLELFISNTTAQTISRANLANIWLERLQNTQKIAQD
jgi:hypothetical protein